MMKYVLTSIVAVNECRVHRIMSPKDLISLELGEKKNNSHIEALGLREGLRALVCIG